jgi:rSAM/selenodomain-associated transferase 1
MASSSNRTLVIFAKAPRPGEVKTRLAASMGNLEAARIYRVMGRAIVDELRGGDYRTVVFFDPAEAKQELINWLGGEHVEFHPQPGGDLGDRIRKGFEIGFDGGGPVCVVGTDAPGISRKTIEQAFAILDEAGGADSVFGPALDGGYYLVALRRPAPELFSKIPWSTSGVLALTLERAATLGLASALLTPLADVDRPEDVPPGLLA